MRRANLVLASGLLLVALFSSKLALAVDPGWYGNIGLGISSYSEDELSAVCDAVSVSCTIDNEQTAFRFGFGRKFSRFFSLEGGYLSLGDVTYAIAGTDVLNLEANGPYASFVVEVPLGQGGFSLLGTAGGAYVEGELTASLPGFGKIASESGKTALPFYGLGAAFNAKSGKFTLRLLWERFTSNEDYTLSGRSIDAPDIDLYSLSAIFRFGQ